MKGAEGIGTRQNIALFQKGEWEEREQGKTNGGVLKALVREQVTWPIKRTRPDNGRKWDQNKLEEKAVLQERRF